LFAGIRREFADGAKYHFDDINLEFPNVLDDEIVQQLGFNLFLESADEGGSVAIAQHLYSPRDEAMRDGYGYSPLVVEQDSIATIVPEVGDAILFCTHNMHSIEPVKQGTRITFSFFIGVTAINKLVLWS
jgi:predicted 2-oxoglutarate/Fe(II)-dependent dioxygenase YbiX